MLRKLPLLAALTAAALCSTAAGAVASTSVAVDGTVLRVNGTAAGDEIDVHASDPTDATIVVRDSFEAVDAGAGCAPTTGGMVACATTGVQSVEVHLGDGDDTLLVAVGVPVAAYGEGGNDMLAVRDVQAFVNPGPVLFDGGDGNDRLTGGPAADTLLGGPGNDGLDGTGGDDTIDPGPGQDVVDDRSGANRIEARDGEADAISCGAPAAELLLDPIDTASGCGMGGQAAAPTDCTPEIGPLPSLSVAKLRRTATVSITAGAEAGCRIDAQLAAGRRVLARGAATHRTTVIRLRLSHAQARRLRRGARLRLTIAGSAPGARTVRRALVLRVR